MKFRKKPIVIEVYQWDGNFVRFSNWLSNLKPYPNHEQFRIENKTLHIATLEGIMTAQINDYIICGVNGEFYPCKPDIFDKTYERVEE